MKKSKFSEEKIISIIKEGDAGAKVSDLSHGAGRHTESLRCGINARRDRSVTIQGIADGGFTLLSLSLCKYM